MVRIIRLRLSIIGWRDCYLSFRTNATSLHLPRAQHGSRLAPFLHAVPSLSSPRVIPANVSVALATETLFPSAKLSDQTSRELPGPDLPLSEIVHNGALTRESKTAKAVRCRPAIRRQGRRHPAKLRFHVIGTGNASIVRLMPMPTMTARPASVSIVSARMPQSFLSSNMMSFGHLMSVSTAQASLSASCTANAASNGISDQSAISTRGRSKMLK